MGVERQSGKLVRFNLTPGKAHAFVQVGADLLHAPMVNRGTLEGEDIRPCLNGDRYNPLREGSTIAVDVSHNSEGRSPYIVAWAPKR